MHQTDYVNLKEKRRGGTIYVVMRATVLPINMLHRNRGILGLIIRYA